MDSILNGSENKSAAYYTEWFISAIKSSKDDEGIKVKKLIQNCLDCHNQVKSVATSSKLDEIRLNTTICLLLGCPSINSLDEILNMQELMSLKKSIPDFGIDTFFLAVKGLKNNKYIRGIFPWLPSDIVAEFLSSFLSQSTNLTPLSLALCFEMFYSLLYSSQYDTATNEKVINNIENYAKYLQNYEKQVCDKPNSKLTAYYFMYIIESIIVFLKYLNHKSIEEPYTCCLGLNFKCLKNGSCIPDEIQYQSCIENSLSLITNTLNKLVACISLEVWISWHDLKAPIFSMVHIEKMDDDDDDEKTIENSIQTQVAHTAFRIIRMRRDISSFDEVLNIDTNKELDNFLNQIAADPDYDSDMDLVTLELIEAVKEANSKKKKKLISLLMSRADIFEFKESLSCLKEHMSFVTKNSALSFIKDFIKLEKKINESEEWKCVVLELSRGIKNDDVMNILKEDLICGHSDVLKTKNFNSDFTHICNQLSHQANTEGFDEYLRLCLQSGVDVVRYSIDMALSMSGLSSVFAAAFRIINCVCRSKGENDLCLTTNLLVKKFDEGLSHEMELEFFDFILELLEKPEDSFSSVSVDPLYSSFSEKNLPVHVGEIFEHFVCERLKLQSEDDVNLCLLNLLKVLEKIAICHVDIVLKSRVRLSCVASLIIIHNNCGYLNDKNYSLRLKIRDTIERIIFAVETFIEKDICNYEEDFALLKSCLSRYELNCRSSLLLSRFMRETNSWEAKSVIDQIFNCIWKKNQKEGDFSIPKCSRVEWIWALFIILPSSNENEWLSAMYVTHSYLNQLIGGDSNLVTPTLKLMQEVILLMCDSSKQDGSSVPLQHCFKSFSNAAMKVVDGKLKNEENKFFHFANLFSWWCKTQKVFDCNPEYPVLFLNLLVSRLVDLVMEKHLVIYDNSDGRSGLHPENSTSSEDVKNGVCINSTSETVPCSEDMKNRGFTNGLDHNGLDNSVEDKTYKRPNNHDKRDEISNTSVHRNEKSSISKVVSKAEFNDCINSMVKTFISCIRSSELTSTVAGKLKALCEL